MRITVFLIVSLFFFLPGFAQETVTVISIKANLRGTPTTSGIVVTTVNKGENFGLIKEESPWFLVQTPTYVGWLHGNSIRKDDNLLPEPSGTERTRMFPPYQAPVTSPPQDLAINKVPRTTTKPLTAGESPFKTEYVGVDNTIIRITNSADRALNLTIGGVKYVIAKDDERTIEAEGGNYEYFASAPGVIPASGVKSFAKGYKYTWNFYIVTKYR